jgi:hypothetical protein
MFADRDPGLAKVASTSSKPSMRVKNSPIWDLGFGILDFDGCRLGVRKSFAFPKISKSRGSAALFK